MLWHESCASVLLLQLMFLGSGIFYAFVDQDDMRNYWQSLCASPSSMIRSGLP